MAPKKQDPLSILKAKQAQLKAAASQRQSDLLKSETVKIGPQLFSGSSSLGSVKGSVHKLTNVNKWTLIIQTSGTGCEGLEIALESIKFKLGSPDDVISIGESLDLSGEIKFDSSKPFNPALVTGGPVICGLDGLDILLSETTQFDLKEYQRRICKNFVVVLFCAGGPSSQLGSSTFLVSQGVGIVVCPSETPVEKIDQTSMSVVCGPSVSRYAFSGGCFIPFGVVNMNSSSFDDIVSNFKSGDSLIPPSLLPRGFGVYVLGKFIHFTTKNIPSLISPPTIAILIEMGDEGLSILTSILRLASRVLSSKEIMSLRLSFATTIGELEAVPMTLMSDMKVEAKKESDEEETDFNMVLQRIIREKNLERRRKIKEMKTNVGKGVVGIIKKMVEVELRIRSNVITEESMLKTSSKIAPLQSSIAKAATKKAVEEVSTMDEDAWASLIYSNEDLYLLKSAFTPGLAIDVSLSEAAYEGAVIAMTGTKMNLLNQISDEFGLPSDTMTLLNQKCTPISMGQGDVACLLSGIPQAVVEKQLYEINFFEYKEREDIKKIRILVRNFFGTLTGHGSGSVELSWHLLHFYLDHAVSLWNSVGNKGGASFDDSVCQTIRGFVSLVVMLSLPSAASKPWTQIYKLLLNPEDIWKISIPDDEQEWSACMKLFKAMDGTMWDGIDGQTRARTWVIKFMVDYFSTMIDPEDKVEIISDDLSDKQVINNRFKLICYNKNTKLLKRMFMKNMKKKMEISYSSMNRGVLTDREVKDWESVFSAVIYPLTGEYKTIFEEMKDKLLETKKFPVIHPSLLGSVTKDILQEMEADGRKISGGVGIIWKATISLLLFVWEKVEDIEMTVGELCMALVYPNIDYSDKRILQFLDTGSYFKSVFREKLPKSVKVVEAVEFFKSINGETETSPSESCDAPEVNHQHQILFPMTNLSETQVNQAIKAMELLGVLETYIGIKEGDDAIHNPDEVFSNIAKGLAINEERFIDLCEVAGITRDISGMSKVVTISQVVAAYPMGGDKSARFLKISYACETLFKVE
jgi:hypothetical protein